MNILLLTQCFAPQVGGIEGMMTGMALALKETDHDVTVMADGAAPQMDKDLRQQGLKIERTSGWKPLRRWRKARAAAAFIDRHPDSIVLCDSWKSLELVRNKAKRVVCFAHGMEFPWDPSSAKAARIRKALAKADRILANSAYTLERARPYLTPAIETGLFPPPVDPQPDPPQDCLDELRKLTQSKPYVAGLGRLEPRKGFDRVIEALARTPKLHNVPFVLGGAGADRERLESLAQELGVADRVHFLGRVTGGMKAALLAGATVFAMPARREGSSVEGFGIVYREAGWYGVPAIAGREGGGGDAVLDEQTGIVLDGTDATAIAQALVKLLSNEELRTRMGRAAQDCAHNAVWKVQIHTLMRALGYPAQTH